MAMSKLHGPTTAIAASAWLALLAYFYAAQPGLRALFETLGAAPSGIERLLYLPRAAYLALGLGFALGLVAKDRCLRPRLALAVNAAAGAPALLAIALELHAFLAPLE
jgi:hypothetical protein